MARASSSAERPSSLPASRRSSSPPAERRVGILYVREGPEPNLAIRRRFLPALASLIAVATDRERLGRDAIEAEALRRSDSIKTAVLQAVSHDLRSPLTAIRVAAESLQSPSLSLDEADREALLETVRLEADRLERVVANLLDLSRLQAGAAHPNRELWAVDELLARALDQLGTGARAASSSPCRPTSRCSRSTPSRSSARS